MIRGGRGGPGRSGPGRSGPGRGLVWGRERWTDGVEDIDINNDVVRLRKQLVKWCSEQHPELKSIFEIPKCRGTAWSEYQLVKIF